jgi:hypothetical protein
MVVEGQEHQIGVICDTNLSVIDWL